MASSDVSIFNEMHQEKLVNGTRKNFPPTFKLDILVGYFDRASKENVSYYGVEGALKCPRSKFYRFKMGYCRGSNSRGESLGMWLFLYFARLKNLSHLHLFGVQELSLTG